MRPAPLLTAQDVTAGYGAVPVIRGVSVQVAPGEVVLFFMERKSMKLLNMK